MNLVFCRWITQNSCKVATYIYANYYYVYYQLIFLSHELLLKLLSSNEAMDVMYL